MTRAGRFPARGWALTGAIAVSALVVTGCAVAAGPALPENEQRWRAIAPAPLEARTGVASVWTGEELIVAGGTTLGPCNDSGAADCSGPTRDQVLSDGAAYDPDADTWRSIAPAPAAFTFVGAAWTGHEMVVPVGSATFAYSPSDDAWRKLEPPPVEYLIGGAWDGERLLYWQSEERAGHGDWSLDPVSGRWSAIPDDPFPPRFDRTFVWTGDSYLFLALPTSDKVPHVYRVATYDPGDGAWRVLPQSPVGFGDPRWFLHQGHVVNAFEDPRLDPDHPVSGAIDVATLDWRAVPRAGRYSYDGCQIPAVGSAGPWLSSGGPVLVSLSPATYTVAPACPELPAPAAGAWTGREFVIWGGSSASGEKNTAQGLVWTPPDP